MAGLDPAIHRSAIPAFQKIAPVRIRLLDQGDFPVALPSLQIRFPTNGIGV